MRGYACILFLGSPSLLITQPSVPGVFHSVKSSFSEKKIILHSEMLDRFFHKIKSPKPTGPRLQQNYFASNLERTKTVRTKIRHLTNEVSKLQGEAMQVPTLKAKLDLVEYELREEKARNEKLIERYESKLDSLVDDDSLSQNIGSLEPSHVVSIPPPRSHRRNVSSISSFSSNNPSVFSVCNQLGVSNADLELQLTYEETNKTLFEGLKLKEMDNAKLSNRISQLELSIAELTSSIEQYKSSENLALPISDGSSELSFKPNFDFETSVEALDFFLESAPVSPTQYSPTEHNFDESLFVGPTDLKRRSQHNYGTLRKSNSHNSLLSLNKTQRRRSSNQFYYVPKNEGEEFGIDSKRSLVQTKRSLIQTKRKSLAQYCQDHIPKVISPRPKSIVFF